MTTLTLQTVGPSDHLAFPEEFSDVSPRSSALALFTDFRRHEPLVIDGWMKAIDAEHYMRQSHTRLRLVVDHGGDFIGTVTMNDLSERNMLKKVAAGETRYDILVVDLMTHRHELRALDYEALTGAIVQDVIDTLCSNGEQHCLVVDSSAHCIRGLIAASDVARRLHIDLETSIAPTFADIFSAVHHSAA